MTHPQALGSLGSAASAGPGQEGDGRIPPRREAAHDELRVLVPMALERRGHGRDELGAALV